MRGPIIVEHVTNGSLGNNGSAATTYGVGGKLRVKADGRDLRVYIKCTAATAGTVGVTSTVKPVAHFSDGDVAVSFPVDSAGTTNYLVQPNGGTVTTTTTGANNHALYVLDDGCSSEYDLEFTCDADTTVSGLYILTELV